MSIDVFEQHKKLQNYEMLSQVLRILRDCRTTHTPGKLGCNAVKSRLVYSYLPRQHLMH